MTRAPEVHQPASHRPAPETGGAWRLGMLGVLIVAATIAAYEEFIDRSHP